MSGSGTTAMSAASSAWRMPRATDHARRLVAVHAQRVHLDLDALAVERHDLAVPHHADGLLGGLLRVLEHGVREGARGEVAVVGVAAVGEALERHRQAQLLGRLLHLRAVQRDIDDVAVDRLDGPADGHGIALVLGRHVVERAVRLEVRHLQAGVGRHGLQRADLVGDHVLEVLRLHLDAAAAEAPQIVEARMHADADAQLLGQHAQPVHGVGVAGVEAAGHAGRLDDLHQVGVVADVVGAPALGDIGVEIDRRGHRLRTLARWRLSIMRSAAGARKWYYL